MSTTGVFGAALKTLLVATSHQAGTPAAAVHSGRSVDVERCCEAVVGEFNCVHLVLMRHIKQSNP